VTERCGVTLTQRGKGKICGRPAGHTGKHESQEARKRSLRQSLQRNLERYASDPEYRERKREQDHIRQPRQNLLREIRQAERTLAEEW